MAHTTVPRLRIDGNQVYYVDGAHALSANAVLVTRENIPWATTTDSGALQPGVPAISPASNERFNMRFAGPGTATLQVQPGTAVVSGIMGQILPDGETPRHGPFVPGQGHSALQLKGDPSITSYSSNIPHAQRGIAADFIEVGAWQE